MKRNFIRALWGNVAQHRNGKIQKEILNTKESFPFVIYTFGTENHKWLIDHGFTSRLVSDEAIKWDLETMMYRHKLEVFKYALEDFDEIVFLDWDCCQVKPYYDVWETLNKKESFQANLFQYRTKKCLWRDKDPRKVTNGGFVYIRDKSIPDIIIKLWEELRIWVLNKEKERRSRGLELRFREQSLIYDDEPAMSKYIDLFCGEWCGADKYWNLFEPEVCNLSRKSVYDADKLNSKNNIFIHNL